MWWPALQDPVRVARYVLRTSDDADEAGTYRSNLQVEHVVDQQIPSGLSARQCNVLKVHHLPRADLGSLDRGLELPVLRSAQLDEVMGPIHGASGDGDEPRKSNVRVTCRSRDGSRTPIITFGAHRVQSVEGIAHLPAR